MIKNFVLAASLWFFNGVYLNAVLAQLPTNQHSVHGVAIGGYDAVSYFSDHNAVKGDSTLQYTWNGVKWYFSNRKNLDNFIKEPQKFAPQYGGYCAYGASRGYKAQTDPTAWTITGGKLYLNYNQKVREIWLEDTAKRIESANKYWESIIKNTNK